MEKKERDMEKPVGTHMNPTGTLHRDTRIYKEGHGNSRKGRGGQWGRNLGTLPAGETDVTLGDAILGQLGRTLGTRPIALALNTLKIRNTNYLIVGQTLENMEHKLS